jgi:hypothetical protein
LENLLAHTDELKGKLKETLETHGSKLSSPNAGNDPLRRSMQGELGS